MKTLIVRRSLKVLNKHIDLKRAPMYLWMVEEMLEKTKIQQMPHSNVNGRLSRKSHVQTMLFNKKMKFKEKIV